MSAVRPLFDRMQIFVAILAAIGLIAGLSLAFFFVFGSDAPPQAWANSASAVVATIALAISVLGFLVSEERTRFTNSFAIARRWEEPPMLEARTAFRAYKLDIATLVERVEAADIDAACSHLVNFYWNMEVAINTGWTDATYLEQRFSPSLKQFYPLMYAFLAARHKREGLSYSPALMSIDKLCAKWKLPVDSLKSEATALQAKAKPEPTKE